MWQRLRDRLITQRTLTAIANRECRHDSTTPMCDGCTRDWTGW